MTNRRTFRGIFVVSTCRGRFLNKAVGEGRTSGPHLTIWGMRSPALPGRYEVLAESQAGIVEKAGSLSVVRNAIEKNEQTREGVELLDKVVKTITEPHSLMEWFAAEEVVCLVYIMKRPRLLADIVKDTRLKRPEIVEAMTELIAEGIICKGEKVTSTANLYQLTERGEQYVEMLMAEDRFLETKKQIEERYGWERLK